MSGTNETVKMPVRRIGNADDVVTLTLIDLPEEMEDWGEVVLGSISEDGMATIQEFFGVEPIVTMWNQAEDGSLIPNVYRFSLPTPKRGTNFVFRIWQKGVGSIDRAEIDVFVEAGSYPDGFTFGSGTADAITWVGIGHGQLLVATKSGLLYRATRQRSSKQVRRGRTWRFSKVTGFHIEISSLQNPSNQFARYVPAHLR